MKNDGLRFRHPRTRESRGAGPGERTRMPLFPLPHRDAGKANGRVMGIRERGIMGEGNKDKDRRGRERIRAVRSPPPILG